MRLIAQMIRRSPGIFGALLTRSQPHEADRVPRRPGLVGLDDVVSVSVEHGGPVESFELDGWDVAQGFV
jgi:hypothetical protein